MQAGEPNDNDTGNNRLAGGQTFGDAPPHSTMFGVWPRCAEVVWIPRPSGHPHFSETQGNAR